MKKGFTIVELVIVIAVIAILAAVLIPTFSNVIKRANESKALQGARNALTNVIANELGDNGKMDHSYTGYNPDYIEGGYTFTFDENDVLTGVTYSGYNFTVTSGSITACVKQ